MGYIDSLSVDLDGLELSTDARLVATKSKDFHWFSPILAETLANKAGEIWVAPRNDQELLRVLAACRARRVPVTVRGAGTGNYGQCVPLQGGLILDMKHFDALYGITPDGIAEVGAGAKLIDVDIWARKQGWELKAHPSTKRVCTIGGFISGGGVGMGNMLNGLFSAPGNLLGLTMATMQDPPAFMSLEGRETGAVVRSYGTTGVVTRARFTLTPARAWRDIALAVPDYNTGARFATALCSDRSIPVYMCYTFDAWVPTHFRRLAPLIPKGQSVVLAMVAPASMSAIREMAAEFAAEIICEQDTIEAESNRDMTPFYEYCNNHTTLSILTHKSPDETYTNISPYFPTRNLEDLLKMSAELMSHFPGEMWQRGHFSHEPMMGSGYVVKWTTPERFKEINDFLKSRGVEIHNIHDYRTEESSGKRRPKFDQVAFKHKVDPLGLLNPGKLGSFIVMQEETASVA